MHWDNSSGQDYKTKGGKPCPSCELSFRYLEQHHDLIPEAYYILKEQQKTHKKIK